MKIREFYLSNYPTDELGVELNEKSTLDGMMNTLLHGKDVYEYIGVSDSVVRERLFQKASEYLNKPYDYVYELWLNNPIK
jgi:hypothetical protein